MFFQFELLKLIKFFQRNTNKKMLTGETLNNLVKTCFFKMLFGDLRALKV